MTRGRKPKAREVQLAEGAHIKNPQRFRNEVPKTMTAEPVRPPHLEGYAGDEWSRVEQVMRAAGMWSATYQVTLELYVESYANYRSALTGIVKYGHAIKSGTTADGTVVWRRNPVAVELHKYKDEVLKLLAELGLTPSSRSRLSLPSDPGLDDDPFLRVLA